MDDRWRLPRAMLVACAVLDGLVLSLMGVAQEVWGIWLLLSVLPTDGPTVFFFALVCGTPLIFLTIGQLFTLTVGVGGLRFGRDGPEFSLFVAFLAFVLPVWIGLSGLLVLPVFFLAPFLGAGLWVLGIAAAGTAAARLIPQNDEGTPW